MVTTVLSKLRFPPCVSVARSYAMRYDTASSGASTMVPSSKYHTSTTPPLTCTSFRGCDGSISSTPGRCRSPGDRASHCCVRTSMARKFSTAAEVPE
eukprot:12431340-Karenia_brevis.AAC.1